MLAPIDAGQSGDRTLGRGWGRLTDSLWFGFNPIREEAGMGNNWSAQHQDPMEIRSRDFWVKVVEMLQQNWALIDEDADAKGCTVYFIDDLGRVFDRMRFGDLAQAQEGLDRNGFDRFADEEFLAPPEPPFVDRPRPIYSTGEFWRGPR